jgi:hypothetical protein
MIKHAIVEVAQPDSQIVQMEGFSFSVSISWLELPKMIKMGLGISKT